MKISNNFKINTSLSTQQNVKKIEIKKLGRVEEIKQQIKNGTYKIDLNKTAEAMAKALK